MKRTLTISLDFDWLWRVLFTRLGETTLTVVSSISSQLALLAENRFDNLHQFARRHFGVTESGNRRGVFTRTWPIGATALWIVILLSVYVLVYYVY